MTTAAATARLTITLAPFAGEPGMDVPFDIPVDLLQGKIPEGIAEACFAATNEPQLFAAEDSLEGWIAKAVLPRRELAQIGDMRSMMTGDSVTMGDTRLQCASFGWVEQ